MCVAGQGDAVPGEARRGAPTQLPGRSEDREHMHDHPEASQPLLVDVARGNEGELVVRLCGEVDLLTHRWLRTALDSLELDDVDSVRLELDHLRFCDAHGVRMLNAFVCSGRISGRSVAVEQPSPMVRRVLDIFDTSLLAPQAGLAC